MDAHRIETLLNEVREGRASVSEALDRLRDLPFEDLGFAKIDHHRSLRTGMPEVIFSAGKTAAQVATIFAHMAQAGGNVLATRATREMFEAVRAVEEQRSHEALKGHDFPGPPATGPGRRGGLSRANISDREEGALAPEVKGTGFSPYLKAEDENGVLAPEVKGTGFSPYLKAEDEEGALAPEAKGTGFSPYLKAENEEGALTPEVKGTGFSPYLKVEDEKGALAPEGSLARPRAEFHETARSITLTQTPAVPGKGTIAVVCAGTSDLPVAEEAAVAARLMGNTVDLIADVGVAGIHRLLAQKQGLQSARVLIVCAGMEGALPTVVGGLVNAPVIAVPTSVGYGASFGGVAALLGMLNTCSPNVSVVNIDNGFGAACIASLINHL